MCIRDSIAVKYTRQVFWLVCNNTYRLSVETCETNAEDVYKRQILCTVNPGGSVTMGTWILFIQNVR